MLQSEFDNYLLSCGVSLRSLNNYKSDLQHFLKWAIFKLQSYGSYIASLSELIPFLNNDLVKEYRSTLIESLTPHKTVNRRLSTLRHLSKYLAASNQLPNTDFMANIYNLSAVNNIESSFQKLVSDFASHLELYKTSASTIKNYKSDVNQFITWLNNKYAQSS